MRHHLAGRSGVRPGPFRMRSAGSGSEISLETLSGWARRRQAAPARKSAGEQTLAISQHIIAQRPPPTRRQISGSTPFVSETTTIQVYVDGVPAGGVETLRQINIVIVREMFFLDAAQATARWGGNNPHGAILVVT